MRKGKVRAALKIGLMNLTYDMRRLELLLRLTPVRCATRWNRNRPALAASDDIRRDTEEDWTPPRREGAIMPLRALLAASNLIKPAAP